ncbi:hypothetical protein CLOP_g7179 [Closterium sp. NIES-67]|nr:hypothetical protein CLOP_g7179 [Closterium sp. NIES-67]
MVEGGRFRTTGSWRPPGNTGRIQKFHKITSSSSSNNNWSRRSERISRSRLVSWSIKASHVSSNGTSTRHPNGALSASVRWDGRVAAAPGGARHLQAGEGGGRGGDDYGAWSLCTNHVRPGGVVYSFGIGADVSFDNGMVNRGHKVFGFDPTVPPERVQAMFKDHHNRDQPSAFQFRQLGLAGTDGIVTFFHSKNPRVQSMTAVKPEKLSGRFEAQGMPAPVLRLPTFMCGNGHGFVDVLKMDVEGVEFDVCDAWLRMRSPLPFGQILIEFHDRMVTDAKARKGACLRALARNGFVEVYVSENFQEATYARMAKKGRDDTMA